MGSSPIDELLAAIDALDVKRALALLTSDCRLLTVDGRRAAGAAAVREVLGGVLDQLHTTEHRVSAQWHVDDVWIAEVEADYELEDDRFRLSAVPRVFIVRKGDGGIADLRIYGAHERKLSDHEPGDGSMRIGGRWMPPL